MILLALPKRKNRRYCWRNFARNPCFRSGPGVSPCRNCGAAGSAGTAPVASLKIAARQRRHSGLCLAELSFRFGRLEPDDPRRPPRLDRVAQFLGPVSAQRIVAPAASDLAEGAIRAGALARVMGWPGHGMAGAQPSWPRRPSAPAVAFCRGV